MGLLCTLAQVHNVDVSYVAPQAYKILMYHFTGSIFQVSYLYFSKEGSTSIMSKTNIGNNSN
jgi:hypothetical protein